MVLTNLEVSFSNLFDMDRQKHPTSTFKPTKKNSVNNFRSSPSRKKCPRKKNPPLKLNTFRAKDNIISVFCSSI